ncbi:MAG: THUMP domain-containing protein [Eubacteriales bacterium]|nr:THUMP domain-containing protein [Eubacteriales bacterium]
MRILIPCLLGLERPISFEIEALGYRPEQIRREDGLVLVNLGDVDDLEISSALAEINLWLRTGERVMLEIAEAEIRSFDDLFEFVAAQNW